jgi:hypothetical protein
MKEHNFNYNNIENFYENIITKTIEIKVSTKYLNYLKKLGYNVKLNDTVNISITDLPFGSQKRIDVKCKICSNIVNIEFQNYVSTMVKGNNYKCKRCNTFKNNLNRIYGVDNPMDIQKCVDKIKSTKLEKYNNISYNNREKYKKTCLEKYGVENVSLSKGIKNKINKTIFDIYGVDNISKSTNIKDKKKNSLFKNYGVNSLFSLDNIQSKKKDTVKKRYGVENVFQLESVKEKSKFTMLEKYGTPYAFSLPNKRYKILFDDRLKLYYQGTYEKHFLDFCFNNNINITKPKFIKYTINDKEYKYFPDFYYEPLNLLIEIKSDYIFEINKEENVIKQKYSLINGFDHIFIINKNYTDFIKKLSI